MRSSRSCERRRTRARARQSQCPRLATAVLRNHGEPWRSAALRFSGASASAAALAARRRGVALRRRWIRHLGRAHINIPEASSGAFDETHATRDFTLIRGAHPSRVPAAASRRRLGRPRRNAEGSLRDAGAPRKPSHPPTLHQAEASFEVSDPKRIKFGADYLAFKNRVHRWL